MIERIANDQGVVVGLALDHRDSLRTAAARRGMPTDHATLAAFKAEVTTALAGLASVVLLDLELGSEAIARLPTGTALVMPLEEQGYESVGDGRVTTLLRDFSPADARALGAAGCKLLLPYHLRQVETARLQEAVVRHVRETCEAVGVGLVLEPIVHEKPGSAFAEAVVASARRLAALGPHVLKVQFPAGSDDDDAACRALSEACGSVPWVLLGGGADAGTFLAQLAIACRNGARGFIAGRTVWDAALENDPQARQEALAGTCRLLLGEAAGIAHSAQVTS